MRTVGWAVIAVVLVGAVVTWLTFDPGFQSDHRPPTVSATPGEEFERRVRAYLLENPEVIVEAMQSLQARRRADEQTAVQRILKSRADDVLRDPASPIGGNPRGDVTLVEFFDYNCPYCRQVAPLVDAAAAADSQLRIVYKEIPILGPGSVFASKAALAAHRQERYVAFHQALMRVKGTVDENAVLMAAAEAGLDIERLKTDMQDAAIQAAIERNLALARALRITGTPGFVVGNEIVRGATDLNTLQTLIRMARVAH